MHRFTLKATGIALAATLAWTGTAEAQQPVPISVEVRPGVTFPTGDLSDAGTNSGFSVAGDVFFGLFERFSIYGGYAWHQFRRDDPLDAITAQGPRGGVKVLFPMPGDALPWVRGGLSYSTTDGWEGVDPDGEIGLEFGGGVDYRVSPRFSLSPSLHFKTFTQDLGPADDIGVSFLTLGLGAHFHF